MEENGSPGSPISYAGKAGKLDGVIFTVSPATATGAVDVALSLAGTVVASGQITASHLAFDFKAGDNTEKAVAAGDALQAAYAVPSALTADHQVTARILLTYEE